MSEDAVGRLLQRHFAKMQSPEQADAYAKLVFTFVRSGFSIVAKAPDGQKNDVHFVAPSGARPYALIVNQTDLLFYFRRAAAKPDLTDTGLEVRTNEEAEEMTVRITMEREASDVLSFCQLDPSAYA